MLDYRLRLWAPTSASHAILAVAELLIILFSQLMFCNRFMWLAELHVVQTVDVFLCKVLGMQR